MRRRRVIVRRGEPAYQVHPGEVLREDFMVPMRISSYALAKALRVPAPRVHDIVLERRGVSPDTAVRLSRYFGTSAELWMNLQIAYDLSRARKTARSVLAKIAPREHGVA